MTKTAFLSAYETALSNNCQRMHGHDLERVRRFVNSVRYSFSVPFASLTRPWGHDCAAAGTAWRAIGGKGRPTRAQLFALPE